MKKQYWFRKFTLNHVDVGSKIRVENSEGSLIYSGKGEDYVHKVKNNSKIFIQYYSASNVEHPLAISSVRTEFE